MGPIHCRLTVFKDSEGARKVRYDVSPPGPNPVVIEAELRDDELTKSTIRRLNRFIGGKPDFCEHDDLQILGRHLYHILFDGVTAVDGARTNKMLGERFIETYTQFEKDFEEVKRQTGTDPEIRFRMTLIFKEGMDELAGYPWEFLYVPGPNNTGFFLAGEKGELILTRFVPELGTPKAKPADEKLTILVAWSQPRELGPVSESDTVVAINQLAENIKNSLSGKNIEVIAFPRATHDGLKRMIETKKPHIVHFIGHGQVRQGRSTIALMKPKEQLELDQAERIRQGLRGSPDEADYVDGDSVRALFIAEPPRLVFLHACNSDKAPDSLEVFRSASQQVLHANVPFVVAMQYEISNEDATQFAKTFYEKLGEGLSIDEAVKSGRNELGKKKPAWGHPRFGTPVVYLQADDNVIVKKEIKPEQPLSFTQACPYGCGKNISNDQTRCSAATCGQGRKFKQCPSCRKANPIAEPECLFCNHTFADKQIAGGLTAEGAAILGPAEEKLLLTSSAPGGGSIIAPQDTAAAAAQTKSPQTSGPGQQP